MPNASNDGDSFHVKAAGKEYIFRLYFVDAAETDAGLGDRLAEQGTYFGLNEQQTLQLGEYAKKFARERMARPFVVRTCLQDALGRSKAERFYAFVETDEGDLGEQLVANGLARLHGTSAKPIGLSSVEREWEKLERIEREAKLQRVGAWGAGAGRMANRLPKQPTKGAAGSFDAFFHPDRVAETAEPTAPAMLATPVTTPALTVAKVVAASTPSPSGVPTKLDVNTATTEDLENVPGIGPVLAARIMEARPFKNADDLANVKGIGEKTYAKVRPYFQ